MNIQTSNTEIDQIIQLAMDEIKVGLRHRKDLGDLQGLAQSIATQGLLQPVGITPEGELVFGLRRLLACRDELGWTKVPARIVNVPSILGGEIDENCCRKNFTVSELVAIVESLRSFSHGGDRRSDQSRTGELESLTIDEAAKRVGLGNKDSYYRARKVIESGTPELVEAMDSETISIAAAAQALKLDEQGQQILVAQRPSQGQITAPQVRKLEKLRRIEKLQADEESAILETATSCQITADQDVVHCDLLITDPPQGILPSAPWDNPSEGIEAFTRNWCRRWSSCGAKHMAVFWNQSRKWEAKQWLDESLDGYEFLQECCCHRRNYKKPEGVHGTHNKLRNSWEPVFVYRRKDFTGNISQSNHALGSDLTDDDHHSASYPTTTRNEADFKQHECQKPVSAFRWLIHALTSPGDLVVDPFAGSGTTGIAALQLGRRFHGIEESENYRRLAESRVSLYGRPARSEVSHEPIMINTVSHGDCMGLIPGLPDGTINLTVTSPPYAEQRKGIYPSVRAEDYPEFTLRWMSALWPKLTEDGSVLIVIDADVKKGVLSDYVMRTQLLLREFGWKQHRAIIWHKPDVYPLGRRGWPRHAYEQVLWFSKSSKPHCDPNACREFKDDVPANAHGALPEGRGAARITDVISVPVGSNEKGIDHPAQFPVPLAETLINAYCPEGGTVLDPFAGSGSSLLAARNLGRAFYGFEIVEKYCGIARERLAEHSATITAAVPMYFESDDFGEFADRAPAPPVTGIVPLEIPRTDQSDGPTTLDRDAG